MLFHNGNNSCINWRVWTYTYFIFLRFIIFFEGSFASLVFVAKVLHVRTRWIDSSSEQLETVRVMESTVLPCFNLIS